MSEDAKDLGQGDEPQDDATDESKPISIFRDPHPPWSYDGLLESIYECDLDSIKEFESVCLDGQTMQFPVAIGSNPSLHVIVQGNLSGGEIKVNDLQMVKDFLGAIIRAVTFPDPTLLQQLRAAHKVFLDKKSNVMEKRAAVVLHIARAIRHFPRNIENNPPVARCPNCSDVYTSENVCPDCGAKIELNPDPIAYFHNAQERAAYGLVYRLAEIASEFDELPPEFVIEYLSSDKEPTTIAAYFSCKVGAFGDRGKVWRDVSPVAKRYNDACRTESAKARFAKWRDACATVDEHFGPLKK